MNVGTLKQILADMKDEDEVRVCGPAGYSWGVKGWTTFVEEQCGTPSSPCKSVEGVSLHYVPILFSWGERWDILDREKQRIEKEMEETEKYFPEGKPGWEKEGNG